MYASIGPQDLRHTLDEARLRLAQRATQHTRHLLILALALLCAGILLATLSGGYHGGFIWLHHAAQAALPEEAWEWLTRFGDARLLFVVSLWFVRRRPEVFWVLIVAAVIAGLYSHGMKLYFDELRPAALLSGDQINVIGPRLKHRSFPSGHSISIFVFTGVLAAFARGWTARFGLLGFAALVGISRVALGAHWPQDVIAGAASGLVIAALSVWLGHRWRIGLRRPIHLGLLALPVLAVVLLVLDDQGNPAEPELIYPLIAIALAKLAYDYLRPTFGGRTRADVEDR